MVLFCKTNSLRDLASLLPRPRILLLIVQNGAAPLFARDVYDYLNGGDILIEAEISTRNEHRNLNGWFLDEQFTSYRLGYPAALRVPAMVRGNPEQVHPLCLLFRILNPFVVALVPQYTLSARKPSVIS